MPSASTPLRTGWIKVWITLGVLGLALFVILPIAMTRRAASEFVRYETCLNKSQTQDCDPSIVWFINGWSLEATSSTVSTPLTPTN